MAGAARQANRIRALARVDNYLAPAELAPRPPELVLGCSIVYFDELGLATTGAETVCAIRPIVGSWEVLTTGTANRWIDLSEITLIQPPAIGYRAWPGR